MTKAQVESDEGRDLLDSILQICHDGEIEIDELQRLCESLDRCGGSIPAVGFLREIALDVLQDGVIDQYEAFALKKAFARVVPKDIRGVIETHLAKIENPGPQGESPNAAWRSHPASLRQLDYINALGGEAPDGLTKGDASRIIDRLVEERPPSPRQMMLLRFFDRLDLVPSGRDEVSYWISEWFGEDHRRESAWNWFKESQGISPHDRDPELVPIGAFYSYSTGPGRRKKGCLGALMILPLFTS